MKSFVLSLWMLFLAVGFVNAQENPFDPPPVETTDEWGEINELSYNRLKERKESVMREHETPQDASPNIYTRVSAWDARDKDQRSRSILSGLNAVCKKLHQRVRTIGTMINANQDKYQDVNFTAYAALDDGFDGWKAACDALTAQDGTTYFFWRSSITWHETEMNTNLQELSNLRWILQAWPDGDTPELANKKNRVAELITYIDTDMDFITMYSEYVYDYAWHAAVDAQNLAMTNSQQQLDFLQRRWDELLFFGTWIMGPNTVAWEW